MRSRFLAALVAAVVVGTATPSLAQAAGADIVSVELVSVDGATLTYDGRTYAGPLLVTKHPDGLAITEEAPIEQYLHGIAEMPFAWPSEALAAQAVAARTYLTRRVLGGRSGDEETYRFDICATNRCQVYRGVQYVNGEYGERWRQAVDETEDQILTFGGRPIEAVYTSMVGSRSRSNQDVWASAAVPYLQAVDSPEVGIAPYAQWTVAVSAEEFVEILAADGMTVGGGLLEVEVDDPPEGAGRTTIEVVSTQGTDSILAPAMKGAFNRHGEELFPDALPGTLADGRELPEALLSYTYDITHVTLPPLPIDHLLPEEERGRRDFVRIDGEGWGHGVGMSQWGARIMADEGINHEEILTHYYTGASIEVAGNVIPETVVVGLDWGRSVVDVTVEGSVELFVNGVPFVSLPEGVWRLRPAPSGIAVMGVGDTPQHIGLSERRWPF